MPHEVPGISYHCCESDIQGSRDGGRGSPIRSRRYITCVRSSQYHNYRCRLSSLSVRRSRPSSFRIKRAWDGYVLRASHLPRGSLDLRSVVTPSVPRAHTSSQPSLTATAVAVAASAASAASDNRMQRDSRVPRLFGTRVGSGVRRSVGGGGDDVRRPVATAGRSSGVQQTSNSGGGWRYAVVARWALQQRIAIRPAGPPPPPPKINKTFALPRTRMRARTTVTTTTATPLSPTPTPYCW